MCVAAPSALLAAFAVAALCSASLGPLTPRAPCCLALVRAALPLMRNPPSVLTWVSVVGVVLAVLGAAESTHGSQAMAHIDVAPTVDVVDAHMVEPLQPCGPQSALAITQRAIIMPRATL